MATMSKCRKCGKRVVAGTRKCPHCNATRVLSKDEMRACGLRVVGGWADSDFPTISRPDVHD